MSNKNSCNTRNKCCNKHNSQCKCHNSDNIEKYILTHGAEALVLSCIDYRFVNVMTNFLQSSPSLTNSYDPMVLAGASLGYNQKKFKAWQKTFIDHVKLAIELHDIKQMVVFDHMDCGAYVLFYPDIEANSEEERKLHIKNIKLFICQMKKLFPQLLYSGYLINDDNTIDNIIYKK